MNPDYIEPVASTKQFNMPIIEANSSAMTGLKFKVIQFFSTVDEVQINGIVKLLPGMMVFDNTNVKKLIGKLNKLDLTNETRKQLQLIIEQLNKH